MSRFEDTIRHDIEAQRRLRERDEARTALHQALGEVISAPSYTDTDCLIDQLEDRGFRVVRK